MATFPQIKTRILTKYQSLPTQKEKLEFLFEVQERLRIKHNEKGADFRNAVITEAQWKNFVSKWGVVNQTVAEQIAKLRDKVFTEDYGLETVGLEEPLKQDLWQTKKKGLKDATFYKSNIDTIWQ